MLLRFLGWTLAQPAHATNYLVIVADDLGADQLNGFAWNPNVTSSPPFTPNLDHLGATGLRFTEAWANPVCSPTRSALLTGDYAFRTEIGEPLPLAPELKRSAETLPELFGIHSGLFGKWHLGLKGSLPADWSVVGNPAGSPSPTYVGGFNEFVGYLDGEPGQYLQWNKVEYVSGGGGWTVATEQLYVDDYNASAAYLWLWDQTVPPPTSSWLAVLTLAAPHTGAVPVGGGYEDEDLDDDMCSKIHGATPDPAYACVTDGVSNTCSADLIYRGLVECLDERVGMFLDNVGDLGALDDTLIVFLGDNGTPGDQLDPSHYGPSQTVGDQGKGTVRQSGVRVPLIITEGSAYLGQPAPPGPPLITTPGLVVTSPVQVTDVAVTIAAHAGLSWTSTVDGVNLAPCLGGATSTCLGPATGPTARTLFAEEFKYVNPSNPASGLASGHASVKKGRNKLNAEWVPASACFHTDLYDLGGAAPDYEEDQPILTNSAMTATLRAALASIGPTWMGSPIPWCP